MDGLRNKNISDYFADYKSIKENTGLNDLSSFKKIKIAILSSFTIKGLKEVLFVKCFNLGIIPDIYIGEYNQYNQEILEDSSNFYNFKPDLVFLFIDTKIFLGDAFFEYYQLSDKELITLFENNIKQLTLLCGKISQNLKCKIILHNFEVPVYSPLGIIDNKQKLGLIEFIKNFNSEIIKQFKGNNQIFIFDYELFCSKYGKENIIDYKMYYLGDIKIDFKYFPKLCDEYLSYIKSALSLSKKIIVLDLDNTLWGGIIGEDGLNGIKLGPNPEGRPFYEFQKYILSLFNRGIILAINSKNNPDDALLAIKNHPYMILKEDHFASIIINWNDKISNMKFIAEELNIGLDSFVYFDDDKLNREMIRTALPEVLVVELPEDPSLYLKTVMELNEFNSFSYSDEDKMRGQMYSDQRKRLDLSASITDITQYLNTLNMTVTIEHADFFNIPRIAQLTQKTNQFNMTTRRYSLEDIINFSESKDFLIFSIKVEDKFGDNGITGVAIINKTSEKWIIDTFLLSCRIIGRCIEETMLAYILEEAKKENIRILIGEFILSKKNNPAREFYKKNNFNLIKEIDESQFWEFPVEMEYKYPEFIKVKKKWKN